MRSVLDVTECYQLTSTSLLSLPQQTALQELYLRKCRNVSDECLQIVIKSCHMLTHLDLSFIPSVTVRPHNYILTKILR